MSVNGEQHFLNLVIVNKSDLSDKPLTIYVAQCAIMFGAFMRSMSDHTQLQPGELHELKIAPGETKSIYASGVNALPIGPIPFKVPGAMGTRGSIILGAEGGGAVARIDWNDPIDNYISDDRGPWGPNPSFSVTQQSTDWLCLGGNPTIYPGVPVGIQQLQFFRSG